MKSALAAPDPHNHHGACPKCGYCPCCGRPDAETQKVMPGITWPYIAPVAYPYAIGDFPVTVCPVGGSGSITLTWPTGYVTTWLV